MKDLENLQFGQKTASKTGAKEGAVVEDDTATRHEVFYLDVRGKMAAGIVELVKSYPSQAQGHKNNNPWEMRPRGTVLVRGPPREALSTCSATQALRGGCGLGPWRRGPWCRPRGAGFTGMQGDAGVGGPGGFLRSHLGGQAGEQSADPVRCTEGECEATK